MSKLWPVNSDGKFTWKISEVVDKTEPPIISGVFRVFGFNYMTSYRLKLEAKVITEGDVTVEEFNSNWPCFVFPTDINDFIQTTDKGIFHGTITFSKKGEYMCVKFVKEVNN